MYRHCVDASSGGETNLGSLTYQQASGYWAGSAYLDFEGALVGWSDNGLDAQAVLPHVSVVDSTRTPNETSPGVVVEYPIPGANHYNWGYNPQPVRVDSGSVQWSLPVHRVVSPTATAWEAKTYSAVLASNQSALHGNDRSLFVAGALIGTAGAALLTALDALIEPLRRPERFVLPRNVLES
jgi:hypothetical protein